MDGWMDPQLLLPQVVLPADGLALSIVPRGSEPSRDGRRTRVIFSPSPVSGLQSHRDERACRHRSGICASRERARGVRAAASGPCAAPEGSAPPAGGGGRSSEQKRQVHVLNGCVQSFKNKTTPPQKIIIYELNHINVIMYSHLQEKMTQKYQIIWFNHQNKSSQMKADYPCTQY